MKTISRNVNRTELLALLESVSFGLSSRDIQEQSACFVFDKGEVMTYNDEVACRAKVNLKLKGAVQAKPLLAVLEKMPDDTIELHKKKGELLVIGKRRKAAIRMEAEVLLPMHNVDKPGKFHKLNKHFAEAVGMANECTGKDNQKFWTVCVHIHPEWVEACDGTQILRYKLDTGVKRSMLVRGSGIKCIVDLEMRQFSETTAWIHFRNKEGLVVSVRRYIEDDVPVEGFTRLLKVKGARTMLPKGLSEAADRASIFSSENSDNDYVEVSLKKGDLTIKGEGVSGCYTEHKRLRYKGPTLEFLIKPKLFQELAREHEECEISGDKLKVNGGSYVYVACLGRLGESNDEENEEEQNEEGDDETADED